METWILSSSSIFHALFCTAVQKVRERILFATIVVNIYVAGKKTVCRSRRVVRYIFCHSYRSAQERLGGNATEPEVSDTVVRVGGMGKEKCQWGRSVIVVGFCFGFEVISTVVLVELLRPWESLPNAVVGDAAVWTCVRIGFLCA